MCHEISCEYRINFNYWQLENMYLTIKWTDVRMTYLDAPR